jgi:ankyrin repeat protein
VTGDRREVSRRHKRAHDAYRAGDINALRAALDDPPDFPNCRQPFELAVGDHPLEYAIYWSPLAFIAQLIGVGADPNYQHHAGFPSLIAALSSGRPDKNEMLKLLLESGADVGQRGLNDWTPLHCAVVERDLEAVKTLLAYGADPNLRTRIDDYTTPVEDAESLGFTAAVELMLEAESKSPGARWNSVRKP